MAFCEEETKPLPYIFSIDPDWKCQIFGLEKVTFCQKLLDRKLLNLVIRKYRMK